MSYAGTQPETFPGGGWYEPSVSTSATATTLPMDDADKRLAENRRAELERRGGFGFGAALKGKPKGKP